MGLVVAVAGCLPADHPLRYPSILEVERTGPEGIWPADLDGDGRDEALMLRRFPVSPSRRGPSTALLFQDIEGRVFEQTNYVGDLLPPRLLDLQGDGRPEVVVPVIRHDSLFVSVASADGRKLYGFLLATGAPRVEPDGVLPWDPLISGMWALDLDGDGVRELVTALTTGYARHPRGILVHSLPDGERLGEALVGAPPVAPLMGDFDGDGRREIFVATQRTLHGADEGGFDDSRTYLILFELEPELRVSWSRQVDAAGTPVLGWTGHDRAGRELLMARGPGPLQIEVLEPGTFRVLRRRTIEGPFFTPVLIDLDRDLRPEVVASSAERREIVMVDDALEVVRRVRPPLNLTYGHLWPDLDGDGVEELEFEGPRGVGALLAPDLSVKALVPRGSVTGVRNRGAGRRPELLLDVDGVAQAATLRPNRWYLPLRYGPPVATVMLLVATGLVVLHVRRLRYRLRVVHAAGMEALEADGRGLMVLDTRGRIPWSGPGLGKALGDGEGRIPDLGALEALEPSLAGWCRDVLARRPARSRTARLTPDRVGEDESVTVTASPVIVGSSGDPHWIVRLGESKAPGRAWPMMAQRVAHSVKNPLTHMLLTVQRLQAEYRERAPAVAGRLDPYADRIQDGIGQLRRLTSNFLKLVDLAEPELEETDVLELVRRFADRLRSRVPHDIQVRTDVRDGSALARVDREQLLVALDNLATNAVNALEDGGTITLGACFLRDVRLEDGSAPADYVQIELMDTGKGIEAGDRERVFEAGFTTAEDGTGLGLAIVRKVVLDHGGRISFQTDSGVGTVFTLHLPVTGPEREEGG